MKWRIAFARTAEKELAKLSSETRLRVGQAIRGLEESPVPLSAKRLREKSRNLMDARRAVQLRPQPV